MPRQEEAFADQMRRALDVSGGTVLPASGMERREGSLRGLGAMVRLANVRHAAPTDHAPSAVPALDDETIVRRAILMVDAIEALDQLGLSRGDAASRAGLSPEDLDLLLRGDLAYFDESTLSIVLGRLPDEEKPVAGRGGDDA